MRRKKWQGIEDFGTLDRKANHLMDRWTAEERALQAEIDGERRQQLQILESTGRLVARLVSGLARAASGKKRAA